MIEENFLLRIHTIENEIVEDLILFNTLKEVEWKYKIGNMRLSTSCAVYPYRKGSELPQLSLHLERMD